MFEQPTQQPNIESKNPFELKKIAFSGQYNQAMKEYLHNHKDEKVKDAIEKHIARLNFAEEVFQQLGK